MRSKDEIIQLVKEDREYVRSILNNNTVKGFSTLSSFLHLALRCDAFEYVFTEFYDDIDPNATHKEENSRFHNVMSELVDTGKEKLCLMLASHPKYDITDLIHECGYNNWSWRFQDIIEQIMGLADPSKFKLKATNEVVNTLWYRFLTNYAHNPHKVHKEMKLIYFKGECASSVLVYILLLENDFLKIK